jgi:hypothetical protein
MSLAALLAQLAAAAAKAAVDRVVELIGKRVSPKPKEPPQLTWKDVEHIRQQERDSIAKAKAQAKPKP